MSTQAPIRYTLVAASADDVGWLDQLRRDAYRELFDLTWGAWDEVRHQRHFADSLEQGGIEIIVFEDRPVGMIQLVQHAGAVEVGEIQIRPEEQNCGIGAAVLQDVIRSARERRRAVRLSTGLKNARARRLYERIGFRVISTSDTHFNYLID